MKNRTPRRVGAVLTDLVERLEFRERLREYTVWTVWDEVVGDLLAARAQPTRIEHGKLFVRVSNSAWMQELQFLKDEIRSGLNHRLGREVVRDIFCVLGSVKRKGEKGDARKLHPVDEQEIAQLVPNIDHPDLEGALRAVARARARRLGPDAG